MPSKKKNRNTRPTATVTTIAATLPPIGMIAGDERGGFIVVGHVSAGTVIERADGTRETLPPAKTPPMPKPGSLFCKAAQQVVREALIARGGVTVENPLWPHIRPGLIVADPAWSPGPSIIVDRHGVGDDQDTVTLLSSNGFFTEPITDIPPAAVPEPKSPLDRIADGVARLVRDTPDLLPIYKTPPANTITGPTPPEDVTPLDLRRLLAITTEAMEMVRGAEVADVPKDDRETPRLWVAMDGVAMPCPTRPSSLDMRDMWDNVENCCSDAMNMMGAAERELVRMKLAGTDGGEE
jgi:hypothetical protein